MWNILSEGLVSFAEVGIKSIDFEEYMITLFFTKTLDKKVEELRMQIEPGYVVLEKDGDKALGFQQLTIYKSNSAKQEEAKEAAEL